MHDYNCKISVSDDIQQKFQIAARTHIAVDYYRRQGGYVLAGVCLLRAIVSKVLKLVLITPLVKKPDLDSANTRSYRPIFNLSTLSQLLSINVFRQFYSYLSAA